MQGTERRMIWYHPTKVQKCICYHYNCDGCPAKFNSLLRVSVFHQHLYRNHPSQTYMSHCRIPFSIYRFHQYTYSNNPCLCFCMPIVCEYFCLSHSVCMSLFSMSFALFFGYTICLISRFSHLPTHSEYQYNFFGYKGLGCSSLHAWAFIWLKSTYTIHDTVFSVSHKRCLSICECKLTSVALHVAFYGVQ